MYLWLSYSVLIIFWTKQLFLYRKSISIPGILVFNSRFSLITFPLKPKPCNIVCIHPGNWFQIPSIFVTVSVSLRKTERIISNELRQPHGKKNMRFPSSFFKCSNVMWQIYLECFVSSRTVVNRRSGPIIEKLLLVIIILLKVPLTSAFLFAVYRRYAPSTEECRLMSLFLQHV